MKEVNAAAEYLPEANRFPEDGLGAVGPVHGGENEAVHFGPLRRAVRHQGTAPTPRE